MKIYDIKLVDKEYYNVEGIPASFIGARSFGVEGLFSKVNDVPKEGDLNLVVLDEDTKWNAWIALEEDGRLYLFGKQPIQCEVQRSKHWWIDGGWYLLLDIIPGNTEFWKKPCRIIIIYKDKKIYG